MSSLDVVVVGGCGHVGLPLALAFADRGLRVGVYDTNEQSVKSVLNHEMPFREEGGQDFLDRALSSGRLVVSTDPTLTSGADAVVVVIGTPVDEHLNPDPHSVPRAIRECIPYLRNSQLLVLRSTLYPGVTQRVEEMLAEEGLAIDVSFCPERIAEGHALTELFSLPQIVAGRTSVSRERAAALFGHLTDDIIELEPEEAELAKLFTNVWRYVKFAAANQFYIMANDHGLDFDKIRRAVTHNYPRASDMPGAGFAAGPCLFKDTMQLAAFADNSFVLGHTAMLVNEGLPLYVVSRMEARYRLSDSTVGILGMAFKAGSDDTRSSLSYKLRRILEFKSRAVVCTDPYVTDDPSLLPLGYVLDNSDVLVIAAPHDQYRQLRPTVPVVDVWNLLGQGSVI